MCKVLRSDHKGIRVCCDEFTSLLNSVDLYQLEILHVFVSQFVCRVQQSEFNPTRLLRIEVRPLPLTPFLRRRRRPFRPLLGKPPCRTSGPRMSFYQQMC